MYKARVSQIDWASTNLTPPLKEGRGRWGQSLFLMVLMTVALGLSGCSLDPTPKRVSAYLPSMAPSPSTGATLTRLPVEPVSAVLVMVNDTGFEKSAPALRSGTLQRLGVDLKGKVEQRLPIRFSDVMVVEDLSPQNSTDFFVHLAQERNQPYAMVAVLSSTERERFEYFPMAGSHGGGLVSAGLPGYRTENHARLELVLLDVASGQPVFATDGQASAVLEQLKDNMKSNVFPVVRRDQLHSPIYPKSHHDAYETLMLVAGLDAVAQAVMELEDSLPKRSGPRTGPSWATAEMNVVDMP